MKRLNIFIILFVILANVSFGQSGDAKMDEMIKDMIVELDMQGRVKEKFIIIYQNYGSTMKKAKKSDMGLWNLYLVFRKASERRDLEMKKILPLEDYKLYMKRQKAIDKYASNL